ncbi:glutamate-5-semialdehyde dehydrogenase [Megasphaera sp. AM44-1BH]|uniref:glutamate-5-semialdehyde dehydrogenase n=1 Tax=Megasphaera sp. AM44-1BH TaxID=2292358 RepID=UPI000E46F1EA|nr:glutamate-5-semialdehyde dehydrogenase [Megasphaera sp. AM44-1BH]RHA14211.1 glutamate-5-semialdehyde dehydrogenase [Megasphaera sp. AM44-1BH]
MESEAVRKARAARQASYALANADTTVKNKALSYIADDLLAHAGDIMDANAADVAAAREKGMSDAMIDRLTLTQDRIQGMAEGVRQVIALPDPVGQTLSSWDRPNGLHIDKVTVPLGVIAIIFESRPNVTVDAAVLCLKSGNATVLRGGSEAIRSNVALAGVIRHAIARAGLPSDAVTIMENTDRALVSELLTLRQYINLAIPRGGAGLIRMVVDTAKVPVIETGSGVCHVYVDKDADLDMAVRIIENAKVSRPSTCNAMETLLVHKDVVRPLMEKLVPVLKARHVEMRADTAAREAGGDDTIGAASEEDWRTEYNALIMSIRTVASIDEALDHIRHYSTHHSESIITENTETAERFLQEVDSAAVYVNASTRFTDGFEFGFGAEIGISTQKLHARGPMGLEALVSYKYLIHGQGQIRL